jgi:hypothetical protein
MGLLDEAIREHLDLKRRRGADASEVSRQEQEALGPARRGPEPLEVPADHDAAAPGLDGLPEGHDAEAYHEPEHAELEQPVVVEHPEPAEHVESVYHEPEPAAAEPAAEAHPEVEAHAPPQEPHDSEPVPESVAESVPESLPEPPPAEQTMAFDVASEIAQEEAEARRAQSAHAPEAEPHGAEQHEHEQPPQAPEPAVPSGHEEHKEGRQADPEPHPDDVLEETPEFLQETPEHDRLWFEQRPPKDFDFDK